MIKLSIYNDQLYNKDKNIGHMRFDFVSGGKLANSFVAGAYFNECSDKKLLQAELNEILFEQLDTWQKVGAFINEDKILQEFTLNDTVLLYAETEKFQYLIRLLPSEISRIYSYEK